MSDGNHNPPAVASSGLAGMVERLRLRTLVQHGGPKGMSYGWNLTENDSELHRDAAEQLTRLAGDRQVLACQVDSLRAALVKVLDTREKEAKAFSAWQVAYENFSGGARLESRQHLAAMTAASTAEKEARLLLATLKTIEV